MSRGIRICLLAVGALVALASCRTPLGPGRRIERVGERTLRGGLRELERPGRAGEPVRDRGAPRRARTAPVDVQQPEAH
jgi:hypothetical protein